MTMKVIASGINFAAITKSDSTLVNCKAIYIGSGGDLAISPSDTATAITFKNTVGGTILPVELKSGRVMSTNTTASDLIALGW